MRHDLGLYMTEHIARKKVRVVHESARARLGIILAQRLHSANEKGCLAEPDCVRPPFRVAAVYGVPNWAPKAARVSSSGIPVSDGGKSGPMDIEPRG